jgi:hypothetical protein
MILEEWLKSLVEYQRELEIFAMGVLQSNAISPLIAKFILDGL